MSFTTTNGLRKLSGAASGAAGLELEKNWLRLGVRYAEAINPKGYKFDGTTLGAVGDGSNDDTAELQAAIDEAAAQGLPLFIPAGTYKISDTLVLPSDLHMVGLGRVILKLAANTNKSILKNSDQANGNSNIRLTNLICDGNLANQAQSANGDAFSVIRFDRMTDFGIDQVEAFGGYRHGTYPSVSSLGEGLELIRCERGFVRDCFVHDNRYDGLKIRGGEYIAVSGLRAKDNARSGIQITWPSDDSNDQAQYISVSNTLVEHTTGTPGSASPATSGIYFHGASRCVISGLIAIGLQNGVGTVDNSVDNVLTNLLIRHRDDGAGYIYALDIGGDTTPLRWTVSNFSIMPLSGAPPKLIRLTGDGHILTGGILTRGAGSGTATVNLSGTNHILHGVRDADGNVALTDTSTGSATPDSSGL